MKLSLNSIISSISHSAEEKKNKKKPKNRSMSRSETLSFGSNTSSSSSGSSSDSKSTPKTVLPPLLRRNMSSLDPENWPASASSSVSELFGVFDRDGDGKITKQDLELVLHRLGSDPPTEEEVFLMLAEADRDGDGCISLEEFGAIGSAFGPPESETDRDSDLRDAFGIFDADGDGKISAEELLGVFLTLGDKDCTLDDCRRMIGGVDSDGDGFVCFEDFGRMMCGQGW